MSGGTTVATTRSAQARPDDVLLEVKGLQTHYVLRDGVVRAVDGVDLTVRRGRTLCVVGESGSGKSATAQSILQLVEEPGRLVGGQIVYHRRDAHGTVMSTDLATLDPRGHQMREVRGGEIAMVFQEPMSSLSPVHTVGEQVMEAIYLHTELERDECVQRAVDLLDRVRLPNARRQLDAYTFELSGGMRQRVALAAALACDPALLIADEPTTALDVTTQAQMLDLIAELQREMDMAVMFITHDLGVVAEIADDVAVMYQGLVVEQADVDTVFHSPQHPYTQALLRSVPRPGAGRGRLVAIAGAVPSALERPRGCPFHPRCDQVVLGTCDTEEPPVVVTGSGTVRCWVAKGAVDAEATGAPPVEGQEDAHGRDA